MGVYLCHAPFFAPLSPVSYLRWPPTPSSPHPQALRILLESYGFNDARVAFALHNLGGFFLSQGRLAEAADAYEKALQVAMT